MSEQVESGSRKDEADGWNRIIPKDPQERARLALAELFAPVEPDGGWRIRRWDEAWWRYDGVRFCPMSEESLRAVLTPWLSSFYHLKEVKGDDGGRQLRPVRFVPKDSMVTELVNYLKSDTLIETKRMPAWIADHFVEGSPVWPRPGDGQPWKRVLTTREAVDSGLPDPLETIIWHNGVMDIRAWLAGKLRLLPHSERLFAATALPYDCPVKELVEVGDDAEGLDRLIGTLAPTWVEFLDRVSGGDPEWEFLLSQFCGYCLTPWTKYEVILVMTGASRAGKGTIMNGGLTSLVGDENVASSSPAAILDKFHLYTLIGKHVAVMPDADVGRSTDAILAAETIKKISGGDPIYADRKHKDPLPAVRLSCKIVIMCNRMPTLPDPTGALANRFRVLPFEESAAGKEEWRFKDPEIMDREAVGRMIWALRGLKRLVAMDRFVQPVSGAEVLDEYRDYADPLRKFAEDCLKRADGTWTSSNELYEVWKRWCNAAGQNIKSHAWFCLQLRTACPWIRRVQRRVGGDRSWGYEGVTITSAAPDAIPVSWAPAPPL